MESNKVVPPHLNAEVYRTDTTGTSTLWYLDYIKIHTDGSILLGSSELTGRYWNGAACIFSDIKTSQELFKTSKKSILLSSGNTDGCFIENSTKVLLCEDSGSVSIWSYSDDAWNLWVEEVSAAEHDNAALAVECFVPGKEYCTVGADGNIKVWDVSQMICTRNYNAAHTEAIYGISARPNSTGSFATCSLDQYVTLWDDNISKSVLDLLENDCGIRCIKWLDDNRLVYGDEAGVLGLVDIRNTADVVKLTEFPAAVHRVTIQPESRDIAVCCDNKIVTICEINDSNKFCIVYRDKNLHNDFVRGLAWDLNDKNLLHSAGWDGEIKTHNYQKLMD